MVAYKDPNYDPQARRERYLRDRELKGRKPGVKKPTQVLSSKDNDKKKAQVKRLTAKVATLEKSLTAALAALSEKRRTAASTEKQSSDGKTTAKERQESKEYREKNQTKIANEREKESTKTSSSSSSSSSSSGSSTSSSTSVSSMTVEALEDRVASIRSTLKKAKSALAQAKGSLSHSASLNLHLKHIAPIDRKESVLMDVADFGGWATRHDVLCTDGRTILPSAFKDQDGLSVPLVYAHGHKSNEDVLGHAILEYVPPTDGDAGGVYAHAFFNKTPKAVLAKEQVQHGDLKYLSIFANNLTEKVREAGSHLKDVLHGKIREVSLVLAGANDGAFIDHIQFAHSEDGEYEGAAVISMGLELDLNESLKHSADPTLAEIMETLTEEQGVAVDYLLGQALSHTLEEADFDLSHADVSDDADDDDDRTLQDILDTLDDDQMTAVNYLLAQALTHFDMEESSSEVEAEDSDSADDETETDETDDEAEESVSHDNLQEDSSMTHNIFDQSAVSGRQRPTASLQHGGVTMEEALRDIVKDAKKNGSLKDAIENYIEHTGIMVNGQLQHGIENLDYLFPDAQTLENSPAYLSRRQEWVDKVLGSVRKSPFSRIKTITADITPDEARARGYIKGNFKNEEFFALSKRETTPQTIYKKQKLDRDDVIDITTLDVVAWLKAEMKVMLDEELAGAILVGDGRSIGDDDKILETHIRPIASDAELYVTTVNVNLDDASSSIEELVDAVIANRRYYKGSGTPTFYTTEGTISAFLTVKDNFGRRLYSNLAEVAAVLRVAEVVPVEVMERVDDLVGIMVNLSDYTLGADRGGQATMFDDFDINYNKLLYLIETRCSGALTQPKAALVFRKVAGSATLVTPVEPSFTGSIVTVATTTGVTYKNADTNATLTTAAPVTLTEGQTLNVVAVPASGYYFANSENDQWSFTNVGS